MSYQVLARKWRPRFFSEMVGQEHVLRALINGLDNDRLHHAYLFTGTRGVGKTTIARILAKCLNCDEGVSSKPCGVCASCNEIAEGRFVDLIEVDAASRTKVEDTRELLENVQYLPTRGRFKVYLIDEVHMLTNHSFNALLKTLEEPPPHVKFLLATTDPQKLPVTVLSRCLQFNLKNLGPERIVSHLNHILAEEKIPYEESALWALGRAADGSMRDALSLTDQAIAHGGGTLTVAEVSAMLGTIDRSSVVEICQAIADSDAQTMMASVDVLAEHSPDYSAALADMLALWHQVAIAQTLPDALDPNQEHHDIVLDLARRLSREDVQLFYQISLLGRKDLPFGADPRSGFEMVLLRMIAFKPHISELAEKPVMAQGSEAALSPKKSEPETQGAAPASPKVEALDESVRTGFSSPSSEHRQHLSSDDAGASRTETSSQSSREGSRPTVFPAEPESMPEVPSASEEIPPPWVENYPFDEEAVESSPAAKGGSSGKAEALRADLGAEPPLIPSSTPTTTSTTAPTTTPALIPRPAANMVATADAGVSAPDVENVEKVPFNQLGPSTWRQVCLGLGNGGLIQNLAADTFIESVDGNKVCLLLDENNSALYNESLGERLQQTLRDYFACDLDILVRIGKIEEETPRMTSARLRHERLQKAITSLQQDPNVQTLCRDFSAQLVESSVKPID